MIDRIMAFIASALFMCGWLLIASFDWRIGMGGFVIMMAIVIVDGLPLLRR